MYSNIVVPLDGSDFAESAVPVAASIARELGAALRLVHVSAPPAATLVPPYSIPAEPMVGDNIRSANAEYLARVAGELHEERRVTVFADALEGEVEATLLDYGERHRPALFVLSTHGRGGLQRAVLGSVADALVRRSSLPVLALRPGDASRLGEPDKVERVMLPLDGSERDEEIFDHARVIGGIMTVEFLLVRVIQPITDASRPAVRQIDRGDLRERRTEAKAYLDRIAEHLGRYGSRASVHLLVDDDVAKALLGFAAEHSVDLIAMATRGKGGVERLVAGSVADRLLRDSKVPGVLLYRVR
jgi:nucleotide-binding universal stress UspA family protein